VCEDCPSWDFDCLRRECFSEAVLEALASVTKIDGESYEDFIRRAARNPIGKAVKRADLIDNSDLSRIAKPTDKNRERLAKYQNAIRFLEA
jgi:hypothetical protein